MQGEVTRRGAERGAANVGAETASPHAQQHCTLESGSPRFFGEIHHALNVFQHGLTNRKPAQGVADDLLMRGIGFPKRGVAVPKSLCEILFIQPVERRLNGGLKVGRRIAPAVH